MTIPIWVLYAIIIGACLLIFLAWSLMFASAWHERQMRKRRTERIGRWT